MDFNTMERANIISMAIDASESHDPQEIIDYFSNAIRDKENFQKSLIFNIYFNLGEEFAGIRLVCGTSDTKKISSMLDDRLIVGEDLYSLKTDTNLMALQLKLLDDLNVPKEFRDEAIEDMAKGLSLLFDD